MREDFPHLRRGTEDYRRQFAALYRRFNRHKIAARFKKWMDSNPAQKQKKALREKARNANRVRLPKPKKEPRFTGSWYRRNIQKHRAMMRSISTRHRKQKTNTCFSSLLRTRLLVALKHYPKSKSAAKLLGCSLDLFRLHLQNQFRDGMQWNNHGTHWHIDHIKPCCSFDLSKPEEQAKCFHYSNMQPLLAKENMVKGGRIVQRTI